MKDTIGTLDNQTNAIFMKCKQVCYLIFTKYYCHIFFQSSEEGSHGNCTASMKIAHDYIEQCLGTYPSQAITQAYSLAQTQLASARNVSETIAVISKLTLTTGVFENLKNATQNGTTCGGGPLNAAGMDIYDILDGCANSMSDICDVASIPITSTEKCIPILEKFIMFFEVSITSININADIISGCFERCKLK